MQFNTRSIQFLVSKIFDKFELEVHVNIEFLNFEKRVFYFFIHINIFRS